MLYLDSVFKIKPDVNSTNNRSSVFRGEAELIGVFYL